MTELFFGLKQNSLTVQSFQDGILLNEQRASQNGIAPDAGPFQIYAIDSADSGRKADFVDRTWTDQGEGIGIADGDDGNGSDRKRIDGDEALGIKFGKFYSKTADLVLDRITSTDGAQVRVRAFRGGVEVDSQVIAISGSGRQSVSFSSNALFDEIQISAGDADTKFTFRSINLADAIPAGLSLQQQGNSKTLQAILDGTVIGTAEATQNGAVPQVGPFTLTPVDSADRKILVDRTFFDQGEGIGVKDGDDNNLTQKRIERDEILGVDFGDYLTKDALINVDRVTSLDGAQIKVEGLMDGVLVVSQVFDLGMGSLSNQVLGISSATSFDSFRISAADSDTQFTFRGVELPGAVAAPVSVV
jgi:hypothetical protein